jgi:hypothetical protein
MGREQSRLRKIDFFSRPAEYADGFFVQFFFNETKSRNEVSRFSFWNSHLENPVVGGEKMASVFAPGLTISPRPLPGHSPSFDFSLSLARSAQ